MPELTSRATRGRTSVFVESLVSIDRSGVDQVWRRGRRHRFSHDRLQPRFAPLWLPCPRPFSPTPGPTISCVLRRPMPGRCRRELGQCPRRGGRWPHPRRLLPFLRPRRLPVRRRHRPRSIRFWGRVMRLCDDLGRHLAFRRRQPRHHRPTPPLGDAALHARIASSSSPSARW